MKKSSFPVVLFGTIFSECKPEPIDRLRKIVYTLSLLLLTISLCGFTPLPSTPDTPLAFSRNLESKTLEPDTPLPDSQATLWNEKKPKIDKSDIGKWWSFISGGSGTRLPLKTAAVFIENDDLLLERTALVLIKELNIHEIDTIQLYYPNQTLPIGTVRPDLFIRLRSESNESTNSIYMTGGCTYLNNLHPLNQSMTFIYRDWNMDADITLEPTRSNELPIEVLGWKFGSDLAQELKKSIDKWTDQYGVFPAFPSSFIPEWHPAPKLAFLEDVHARQILSTREPLTYNTTTWIFTSSESPSNLLSTLSAQLQEDGWVEDRLYITESGRYLELEKEDEGLFLRITHVDEDTDLWLGGDIAEQRAAGNMPYFVIFNHLMSLKESQPIIDPFFNGDPTPAQALELADYRGRSFAEESIPVLERLSPKMSATELDRLAHWFAWTPDTQKDLFVRKYFVQSVLKNLWGDYSAEFSKEQKEWAERTSYLKDLLPLKSLPCRLSAEEQEENGIYPLEAVVGTEHSRSMNDPFAVSLSTNRVHCWNVFYVNQSLMLRDTDHEVQKYHYSYKSIRAGRTTEDELELDGKTYPVTIQIGPQGNTWSILISDDL